MAICPRVGARTLLIAGATLVAAACAAPPPPRPGPVTVPAAIPRQRMVAPVKPPADWRDAPQTPGDWRWAPVGGRPVAVFGNATAAPLLALVCDRANARVLIERGGDAAAAVPVTLRTTSLVRQLASDPALGRAGIVAAALAVRDPALDAIAFSRGRFSLEVAGLAPLYLPAWPEVSRVIEDCR